MTATNFGRGRPVNENTDPFGGPRVGPWSQYGAWRGGEGVTWGPNANEDWFRDHPLDEMGIPRGPWPLPPGGIAMGVQALHERGVFDFRQNLMRDAVRGQRAAAGLLQSFRPGGAATLESGIYAQMGSMQMQRALATQPLDLMGDYRREVDSAARRRNNRAQERALAVQAVGTAAGIAATIATGGAAAPLAAAGIAGISGAYQSTQNRKAAEAQQGGIQGSGPQGASTPQYGPDMGAGPQYGQPYGGAAGFQPPSPGGSQAAPFSGMSPSSFGPPLPGAGGPGGAMQSQIGEDVPGGPGGQQGAPGQRGGQGQGAGAMGAGGGVPGSDGVFAPLAYAADSVRHPALQNPIVRLVMADTMVNMVEESGLIQATTFAADRALAKRLAG